MIVLSVYTVMHNMHRSADHFLDKDENILSWKGRVVHMKLWAVSKIGRL